jgi:hypothetical protein
LPTSIAGVSPANDTFQVSNAAAGTLSYSISVDEPWLSVSPANGTSSGEWDTITVSYSTALLRPGTYTASIQVTAPNAVHSPQSIPVTVVIQPDPGDLNGDGYIDARDVSVLVGCMTGEAVVQTDPNCQAADMDHDGDVDQSDFGLLQRCLAGRGYVPNPHCAD